jgi:thioredoxin-disulfide reductase
MYDVLVVGAGTAGLTAAIYTARKKLKTLIVGVDVGGQMNLTNHIENYPGVDPLSGKDLMQKFQNQATQFGAELVIGKIVKVEKNPSGGFVSKMNNGETVESRSVILAFGLVPNMLEVPGEDKFFGKGVSTCVTCDGPLFKGKTVAVVGGGNSAVEGLLEVAGYCKKVYSIHRRDQYTADAITLDKLAKAPNVEFVKNSAITEIKGGLSIQSVTVEDLNTRQKREIPVNGVFVQIGHKADTTLIQGLVETNKRNEVVTDSHGKTNVEGIFAAGDCTTVGFKQTVISAGEGAKAALECAKFLAGGKGVSIDWS